MTSKVAHVVLSVSVSVHFNNESFPATDEEILEEARILLDLNPEDINASHILEKREE